jgi:hypothetical protein
MDITRILKRALGLMFKGKRPMERPKIRWFIAGRHKEESEEPAKSFFLFWAIP